jgi:hypothetical protein
MGVEAKLESQVCNPKGRALEEKSAGAFLPLTEA